MQNNEYLKLFNTRVTALETLGSRLCIHKALVIEKLKNTGINDGDLVIPEERPDKDSCVKAFESAQKEYLA